MRTRRAVVIMAVFALMAPGFIAGTGAQDERELSPRAAFQTALRDLTQEAREAKSAFQLPRLRADFAAKFPHLVDTKLVAAKLLRPVDRDPFTDAYVRWQLTSFLDGLPEISDQEFEQFLDHLPVCLVNPQMDNAFVQPLMRAGRETTLAPSDQKYVQTLIENFKTQREQAGVMRRPAEELRRWIAEHVGASGQRPIQASFENLVSLAKAGWDVRQARGEFEALCEGALRDRTFTDDQRERVAKQIEGMKPVAVLRLTNVYLDDDGKLNLSNDEVAVHDFDLHQWARTIRRQ